MIFSEELDKSLCLILESDKKNRDKIKCFVESIPSELFEQIYDKLEEYKEYQLGRLDMFETADLCLHGKYLDSSNYKYSFVIDLVVNSLSITKSMLVNDEYKEISELTLCMCTRYNNVLVFGRQSIGSFTNYITKNDTEYDLISTLLGFMVQYSNDGFKRYKRINSELILGELNLSSKNRITRVRKMN